MRGNIVKEIDMDSESIADSYVVMVPMGIDKYLPVVKFSVSYNPDGKDIIKIDKTTDVEVIFKKGGNDGKPK